MKVFILCICLFYFKAYSIEIFDYSQSKNKRWSKISRNEIVNKKILISYLSQSKIGKTLVKRAIAQMGSMDKFLKVLVLGETSLTDKTITRKFKANNVFSLSYDYRAVITINRDLKLFEASLDLAHELVHFLYKDYMNLYDESVTLTKFIKATLEERGGEVEAFMVECAVMQELDRRRFVKNTACQRVIDRNRLISKRKTTDFFYDLGEYRDQFVEKVAELEKGEAVTKLFPHISGNSVKFYSAAYSLPYPLAALYEYQAVIQQVCENEKKRIEFGYLQENRMDQRKEMARAQKNMFSKCQKAQQFSSLKK